MARRQITADLMVGADRRTVPKLRDPVNYHIGYVDRFQIIDLLRRHLPRIIFCHDKHNAVRTFIRQKIDIFAIPVVIIIRVAENHTPAIFAARLVDRARHIGKIYIGNIRDDKSDGLTLPLYQTDRKLVRTIIQFPRLR